ncbi:dynamin-binding protein-like [Argiope bruennichi]|uniref:dynamin-binding protein-like n=1 Tax=Argiope bruennichi TaxID=94029 RepID=UPI0024947D53|nr:dynamin-binding protein-like [Argiope bruennichi]XP_055933570.1 dynamin-binding protein-like [Argiope bruennichi]
MEGKPGRLVRAVYDFPTDDPSELPLLIGDIVQVKERIDKQWSLGISNNREGNFPIGFTIEVKIPPFSEEDRLFAVTNDFYAQEDGDLTMKKGDIVIGKQAIDSNWWRGEIEEQSGIFPLTHVWEIDKKLLPKSSSLKKMALKARVKMNLKAQIDEEMDLYQDEIVTIIEEVDKGWYRGECNGRQGIFPASFVTIITEDNVPSISEPATIASTNNIIQNDNHTGYDCINSGIRPYGRTTYPFKAEYANELSFQGGEIVNLIRYVDDNWLEGEIDGKVGIFPANFINIVVDCPKSKEGCSESKENGNDNDMNLFPEDTYGRVKYDFNPQLEGDVTLKEGDTVTLIRKVDSNWYEVVTDNGETGICPESYIEIIGSGPPSYNEVMGAIYDFPVNQSSVAIDNDFGKMKNSNLTFGDSSSFANSNSFSSQSEKSVNSNSVSFAQNLSSYNSESNNSTSDSSVNSFNIYDNKSTSADNSWFNDSGINQDWKIAERNNSFPSSRETYQNVPDVNMGSDLLNWNNIDTENSNRDSLISMTKTPARPPPPSNVSYSRNLSSQNSCDSSANNARLSFVSVSSHSSSETERLSVDELKSQLQKKEETLKIRIACKNKLENERGQSNSNFVSNEMKTQLNQLNGEITQLQQEISNLKAQLSENSSNCSSEESEAREREVARKKELELKRREEEKKRKMKEQRDCIITEILQTERDYLSDLKLLQEIFLKNPNEAKERGINIPLLFGNLEEVIDVASRLLKRLQKVSTSTGLIGECFVDLSDEMKDVYGHYCRNHDEVNSVIDKIDPHSATGQYLQHKVEIMKRQTNCFDLPAMLIKPVQRILKYPLLLNELLKVTEDSHPDKQWLLQATNLMTDVASAVNEFKRKKDLVFKYRKQSGTSFSERISKLTIHSMAKKTSRFGMRISSSFGLKTVIKDQEFEKVERRFTSLEKSLKIFQKDMFDYVKKMEELVTTAFQISEDIAEFYQDKKTQKEVEQFRNTHRSILTEHWENFKQTIERSINSPIKLLLQNFGGPTNLIQKRYDKLLDYESASSKVEKNKDVTKIKMFQDNQIMAKNTYEALNSQLLDDLPKLCDLSVEILYDCIRCFLRAKKKFVGRTTKLLFGLMDLPLLLGSQGGSILDTFQVKHTLVMDDLSQLTILPKELHSCIKTDTLKRNSATRASGTSLSGATVVKSQSPGQKIHVKSIYPHTDLYTACENFDAVDIMDISLKKGDVVGVIKQQDPMGKKLKWFVDNGEAKGFVPAKCLVKFLPNLSSQSPQAAANDWNTLKISPLHSQNNMIKETYAMPQKQSSAQKNTQSGTIQPTRPAPTPTPSLRVVAPSRYPPTTQASPKPQSRNFAPNLPTQNPSNVLMNKNVLPCEPDHRYEEVYESLGGGGQNNGDLMRNQDVPQKSDNIIAEFDPYATSQSAQNCYDNVLDNFNELYSTHRYEDIPEDFNYDQMPSEDHSQGEVNEFYYGMYDFSPTGPNQLHLNKGQAVRVLHKCDLNRNSEWWFVEDRHGKKGYVPAAYLNKYPTTTA